MCDDMRTYLYYGMYDGMHTCLYYGLLPSG